MSTEFDPKKSSSGHPNPVGSPPSETLSATEARQGRKGLPVLKILVTALVLAAIAWGAAEFWGQSTDSPAEQTATPPAGDTTPSTQQGAPTADPAEPPAPAPSNGATPAN